MVSIQGDLSVLFATKYTSIKSVGTGQAINKKSMSDYSIKNEVFQFSFQIKTDTRQSLSDQNAILNFSNLRAEDKDAFFYNGTPISKLSVDKALELVSADGYFGVDKTSQRIVDFVINGAGDNIDRLKAGREGILRGFAEAEKLWGGKLPDISYETLSKSLENIDEKIREYGGSVLDLST